MLRNVSFPAVALVLVAGVGTAAEPAQVQVRENQNQPGVQVEVRNDRTESNQQANSSLEQHLTKCIMLKNQEEINLAKFALDHTQNPQVRAFAETMIRDHEALNQKLQNFGGQRETASTSKDRKNPDRTAATPAERREARQELREQGSTPREAREAVRDRTREENVADRGQAIEHTAGFRGDASLGNSLYQIAKDAQKICEKMTQEELSKEQGANFDKAYMGCQIGAHIAMVSHLKASHSHVSGELQQVLDEAVQTAEQHKQQADEILKSLADNSSNQQQQEQRRQ